MIYVDDKGEISAGWLDRNGELGCEEDGQGFVIYSAIKKMRNGLHPK